MRFPEKKSHLLSIEYKSTQNQTNLSGSKLQKTLLIVLRKVINVTLSHKNDNHNND